MSAAGALSAGSEKKSSGGGGIGRFVCRVKRLLGRRLGEERIGFFRLLVNRFLHDCRFYEVRVVWQRVEFIGQ